MKELDIATLIVLSSEWATERKGTHFILSKLDDKLEISKYSIDFNGRKVPNLNNNDCEFLETLVSSKISDIEEQQWQEKLNRFYKVIG